ncbi:head-tail connector protein [Limosilactobacillus fermentum]|uniref:head-tail connector protein n=1 Tax=Limosilactobacillus fermentum TaxID=1613 RepID=UPI0016584992|nr:head-tail connector protein [Limosilactobacillus fermentum]MBC9021183.1 phage gp6-like head-tail connector protein [Limosilactobacillus fermentum CECT 5716]MCB4715004.1 phage gp6-like head-tail connector protein [Limosilactobacillus fermentum]MCH5396618.1 head-tail connector protein [Limosilactobacillus fermentum]WCL66039.1 phage gp6-like head-tail connector protein [Limosilactobacillus fermentum]
MTIKALKTTVDDDTLSLVRNSLRLDSQDDDELLKLLIKTARADVINQVGERIDTFFDDNDIFDTAVMVEVSHLYTNRQAVSTQETYEVPMVMYSLINSMKDDYRYQVAQLDKEDDDGEKSEPFPNDH